MTVSSTNTSSNVSAKVKNVDVEVFHIDMIPGAMDAMNWHVASELMKCWFKTTPAHAFNEDEKNDLLSRPASEIDASKINTNIIKMGWAMKYSQVTDGISLLSKQWNSIKGRERLRNQLKKIGDYKMNTISLGFTEDVKLLDADAQINLRGIGKKTDTVDEWYAAMGTSSLKVCVRGSTKAIGEKYYFNVEKIGFYLKDTYDFVDDGILPEPLGIWSGKKFLAS